METKLQTIEKVTEKVTETELVNYLTAMGLVNNLNEKEKIQFLEISKAFNLNPFKREIYCTKYGENFSIVVGYESYIKRAERSNLLNGWDITTEGEVSDNSLKAIIKIYRKDWTNPFIHEVYYAEYLQRTKDGRINKFWAEKPITMTKKVAISQGFRMCFSVEIGGMPYTAEEYASEAVYAEIITEIDNKDVINKINNCETIEELKKVWSDNKIYQKDVDVISAKELKKLNLREKNNQNGNNDSK